MIVHASIDLRAGRVVQLVGGRPQQERVSLPDAAGVARMWVAQGFRELHVVDLDGALGEGSNRAQVERILAATDARVQVGGGIRTASRISGMIAAGASRVILGTRAIRDQRWLRRVAREHPGAIVVAADVRGRQVVVDGWKSHTGGGLGELLERLEPLPLAAVLVTDVAREGRLGGIDAQRYRRIVDHTPHSVLAAGGIATLNDLRELADTGVAGAVIGMALYTGAVDPAALVREFAA